MAALSVEEKGKGKRIITQFFRTMPGVQKSLLGIFEKDGYEGISRIQKILYPSNSPEINSTDSLRKGLSMILQHIYGMPVEDKEGYFQEILKSKTANQVVRKEKATLVNYFYHDFPELRDHLKNVFMEDHQHRLMTAICKRFIGEEEEVTDMRSFKNQIRNVREVLVQQLESGTDQKTLIGIIDELKTSVKAEPELPPEAAAPASDDQSQEKRQIILDTLSDDKYQAIRDVLLKKVIADPQFNTFQTYLDNIQSPSARLVANDIQTFSQGVQKIKEFRDHLEQELSA
jgi:hypothetical protein